MPHVAIRAEGLSKRYRIGRRESYYTLRETLMNALARPFSALAGRPLARGESDTIWALKDVSFEIQKGEVVGVIGRNGAGKTTLLKILSRITEPTEGWAEVSGRVGSLLEVGTGFHPELTGRENIYLNGTLLGMKKKEIDRRLDEIVAFAEVEKFLETPVKRYSAGMHTRLAFAVAAHLETEILLVDEVLAVGDAGFQKKCLAKMGTLTGEDRTVLFVSHNLQAVRSVCTKCLLLEEGRLDAYGGVEIVTRRYLSQLESASGTELDVSRQVRPQNLDRLGNSLRFIRVKLKSQSGSPFVLAGDPIDVEIELACAEEAHNVVFGVGITSLDGVRLVQYRSSDSFGFVPRLAPGHYLLRCRIPNLFAPGLYTLELGARCETKGLDWLPESLCFRVIESRPCESIWLEAKSGYLNATADWEKPRLLKEGVAA
ncbi:MAG TPA: ABC transporter ATP-binding protein [Candidatus Acidoferrales bacterium]|nr:ABC transporter ATP-binding protein [Candidatus Acidoferrales bacterium]